MDYTLYSFLLAANISFKFDSGDEDDPGIKSDHSDNSFMNSPIRDLESDA